MKKIINGKMYNTETARKLAEWWNHIPPNDFNFKVETLYIKCTGEYFIHGEGGAMTEYSHRCSDGSWAGGEAIKPITEAEALHWAEEKIPVDEYIKLFGQPEE
jgi:hypothetical protein